MTGANRILLWGLPGDRPLAAVRGALEQIRCPVTLLDQRAVLDTEVELVVGSGVEGLVRVRNETIDLSTVKAVYLRPHDWRALPAIASTDRNREPWQHALNVHDILGSWVELTPALVVNRLAAMAANDSKPYQAVWIESLGFRVPDTLITTDPARALEFWQHHEKVIYKSLSGTRSIVSRLMAEHVPRFEDIASCPTQFQQYIPGTEHRVHVVGEEVFACKIISEADDYRYSAESVDIQPCDLPDDLAALCRRLAASMNLLVAGIDLRCTPEGTWYCFEVNPSPWFTYYQEMTGQPIAEAIARLLASAPQQNCFSSTALATAWDASLAQRVDAKAPERWSGTQKLGAMFSQTVNGRRYVANQPEHFSLSEHDVLTARECAEVRERVLALEQHWTRRSGFYTLGTASYLDAPGRHRKYLELAKQANALLAPSFNDVHQRVRRFFEELLGDRVSFDHQCALPGFHIFVLAGIDCSCDNVAARAHFDLQWMDALLGHVPEATLSFTLPIETPSGGASMAFWPIRYEHAVRLGLSACDYASEHLEQTVTYTPGRIVVHDGLTLHAIGRAALGAPKGLRITLQGHGARLRTGWMLYW